MQKYTDATSVPHGDANTLILLHKKALLVCDECFYLSCDCHPNVSFGKVIGVWCYHLQWHSKEA